jgi:hypothetical protein
VQFSVSLPRVKVKRTLKQIRGRHDLAWQKVVAGIQIWVPESGHVPGSVWAVGTVRDEADIVAGTVEHLLRQGVAGVLLVDHQSSDQTQTVLQALASEDPRVRVGINHEPGFYQGATTSFLAQLAWRAGADFVLPVDADEWFFAPGQTLAEFFAGCRNDVVWASSHEVLPTSATTPLALGSGSPVQVGAVPLEIPKVVFRARRWVWVGEGNHTLAGAGPPQLPQLRLLHFQYRSRAQLHHKVQRGTSGLDAGELPAEVGQHWREQAAMSSEQQDRRWRQLIAGSHNDQGHTINYQRVQLADPQTWTTWPMELP